MVVYYFCPTINEVSDLLESIKRDGKREDYAVDREVNTSQLKHVVGEECGILEISEQSEIGDNTNY
jgi:hypothetical protein